MLNVTAANVAAYDSDAGTAGVQAKAVGGTAETIGNAANKLVFADIGSTAVADSSLLANLVGAGKIVAAESGATASIIVFVVKNVTADLRIVQYTDGTGADDDAVAVVGILSGVAAHTSLLDAGLWGYVA